MQVETEIVKVEMAARKMKLVSIILRRSDVNKPEKVAAMSSETVPMLDVNGVNVNDVNELFVNKDTLKQNCLKTASAFVFLVLSFVLTGVSLVFTHERLPHRDRRLPDVFLDNVERRGWGISVADVMIIVAVVSCLLLVIAHRHRLILLRRVFLLMALLYLLRALTIFVTVLPIPDAQLNCLPPANNTNATTIVTRSFTFILSGGLTLEGNSILCGDYFYSGHTVILTMAALVIQEYTPKSWFWVHIAAWLYAFVAMFLILLAHNHYTLDIVVAYYITVNLFRTYHAMAEDVEKLKTIPLLDHVIWFPVFYYFESNLVGRVPRRYQWPFIADQSTKQVTTSLHHPV